MSADNKDYAGDSKNFANEPVWQVTLRELQVVIANPRFWIGFGAVIALLTITGPFGTHESLVTSTRLVYWASIGLVTYFTGSAIATFVGNYLSRHNLPDWLTWAFGGLVAGLPVGTIAWFMNILLFDIPIERTYSFPVFIGYATGIAIMIATLNYLITNNATNPPIADKTPPSPFFARLPKQLGQALISLEAQDHYIKVKTTKGSELILMRLADAETELKNYPGLRTHRSWWVAQEAIEKVKRTNGKVELVMRDGDVVPVSRSYVKSLAGTGLK